LVVENQLILIAPLLLPTENPSKLLSSSLVNGIYTDENAASIAQLSPGAFVATNAVSGSPRFYRIKQ
jgi:hypothetical protein